MNATNEIKYTWEGINSRREEAQGWISELEDRVVESKQMNNINNKKLQNENRLKELSSIIKCNHIHIISTPEGEKWEKGTEGIVENFSNLGKDTDIHFQEAESPQQNPPKEVHTKAHYN